MSRITVIKRGERYGKLVVKKVNAVLGDNGLLYSLCLCDCGNKKLIRNNQLRVRKSCGCLQKRAAYIHGVRQWYRLKNYR